MKSSFISAIGIFMICESISCSPMSNITTTSKTFRIHTELKANWYRANHYCISNGMRLANIFSKEENDQVKQLIAESGCVEPFWIGGTNLGNEPHYYWMGNKEPITFTDWVEGEPTNEYGNENCIEMRTIRRFKWNDRKCSGLNNFICEELSVDLNSDERSKTVN